MGRFALPVLALCFGLSGIGLTVPAAPVRAAGAGSDVRIGWPSAVTPDVATAIRLTFPSSVAAVDGRLLFDHASLELIGVAPVGGGMGLRPVILPGGAAFGAYDLHPVGGAVRIDLVVVSATGRIDAKVVVGSVASRTGRRLLVAGSTRRTVAARTPVRGLASGRTIGRRDVAIARADWEQVRMSGTSCGSSRVTRHLDVDRDGCADVVDLQALVAARGRPGLGATSGVAATPGRRQVRASGGSSGTFTVDSAADTGDARPGDGICANAAGRCTLRAAITESELATGDLTIDFDLPGSVPVPISLRSRLPYISRLGSSLTIDGYSQPGSARNTATYGSNAIPGVRLRGNGASAHEVGLYITSGGNVVRGLLFSGLDRAIVIDGPDAVGNRIMGNWMGFDAHGGNGAHADIGVLLNTGASDNHIGSGDRADRNVIGNYTKAVDEYGPGTTGNVIQGNLMCIAPGGAAAGCSVGVDHDFGPRDDLIGGDGPGEGNVIGPTRWEGIELSHGFDRYGDHDSAWRISGNRTIGNWIGFRKDGHYDPGYRSGWHPGTTDSAGIHIWDGSPHNLVARNYVASVFDGIRVRSTTSGGNVITGNVVGVSPRGERAPMSGWGISLSQGLPSATLSGNVLRNAHRGGIGLLDTNVSRVRISDSIVGRTSGPAILLARSGKHGANHLLASPGVTSARLLPTGTVVRGTARAGGTVEVYRSARPAGRSGLPARYLGHVHVPAGGSWHLMVFGLQVGDRVTALQIRTNGDTSAMSAGVRVRR